MIITTQMMKQLEDAIAPDASAEIRIYAGGCDIRVRWNKGLREANLNLDADQLALVQSYRDEQVARAWARVIQRLTAVRDMPSR